MFGIPYKIMASVLVGSAILLAVVFAVGIPLNFIM
jgi:hypothetical protein